MTYDWNAHIPLLLFSEQTVSILDTSRGIWIPGRVTHPLQHRSNLLCTIAGTVYHWRWKHLQDKVVTKPDPEPSSATDTPDVSNKPQTDIHAPQKPYILHAPAATLPKLVAHQCIIPSVQPCTPAKPAAAANTQCNQSAVQSSTE